MTKMPRAVPWAPDEVLRWRRRAQTDEDQLLIRWAHTDGDLDTWEPVGSLIEFWGGSAKVQSMVLKYKTHYEDNYPLETEEMEAGCFRIERILFYYQHPRWFKGSPRVLIKWQDYSINEATWEPLGSLSDASSAREDLLTGKKNVIKYLHLLLPELPFPEFPDGNSRSGATPVDSNRSVRRRRRVDSDTSDDRKAECLVAGKRKRRRNSISSEGILNKPNQYAGPEKSNTPTTLLVETELENSSTLEQDVEPPIQKLPQRKLPPSIRSTTKIDDLLDSARFPLAVTVTLQELLGPTMPPDRPETLELVTVLYQNSESRFCEGSMSTAASLLLRKMKYLLDVLREYQNQIMKLRADARRLRGVEQSKRQQVPQEHQAHKLRHPQQHTRCPEIEVQQQEQQQPQLPYDPQLPVQQMLTEQQQQKPTQQHQPQDEETQHLVDEQPEQMAQISAAAAEPSSIGQSTCQTPQPTMQSDDEDAMATSDTISDTSEIPITACAAQTEIPPTRPDGKMNLRPPSAPPAPTGKSVVSNGSHTVAPKSTPSSITPPPVPEGLQIGILSKAPTKIPQGMLSSWAIQPSPPPTGAYPPQWRPGSNAIRQVARRPPVPAENVQLHCQGKQADPAVTSATKAPHTVKQPLLQKQMTVVSRPSMLLPASSSNEVMEFNRRFSELQIQGVSQASQATVARTQLATELHNEELRTLPPLSMFGTIVKPPARRTVAGPSLLGHAPRAVDMSAEIRRLDVHIPVSLPRARFNIEIPEPPLSQRMRMLSHEVASRLTDSLPSKIPDALGFNRMRCWCKRTSDGCDIVPGDVFFRLHLALDPERKEKFDRGLPCTECSLRDHSRCAVSWMQPGTNVSLPGFRSQIARFIDNYMCIGCRIVLANPLAKVRRALAVQTYKGPNVNYAGGEKDPSTFNSTVKFNFQLTAEELRQIQSNAWKVELRCFEYSPQQYQQYGWPHSVVFWINTQPSGQAPKELTLAPPKSMTRRKETAWLVPARHLHAGVNNVQMDTSHLGPAINTRFFLAAVLVEDNSAEDFLKAVEEGNRLTYDACVSLTRSQMEQASKAAQEDADVELADSEDFVKLTDVSTLIRIETPGRALHCDHTQCFDLRYHIESQPKVSSYKHRWKCPVCNRHAYPHQLFVDSHFAEILRKAPMHVTRVSLSLTPEGGVKWKPETAAQKMLAEDAAAEAAAAAAAAVAAPQNSSTACNEQKQSNTLRKTPKSTQIIEIDLD